MTEAFDPYAGGAEDRYEAMARARKAGGVVDTPAGYYVATADGVEAGLRDVDRFVGSFMDVSALPEDEIVISAVPEPRHGRIRRVINTVVAAHRTAQAAPFVRDTARRLVGDALAEQAAAGCVDLVATVVDPLPSAVIAHMLGVPVEDQERFRHWSDELLAAQDSGEPATLSQSHPEFAAYIQREIDRRRAVPDPPDDVITRFLRTDVDGEYLSDAAVRTQTMFLIVAGNETTRNLIGNCLHTLASAPDLYERVREERALVPVVVEESLRHDSPVQVLARAVLGYTEVSGCPLAPGDRVVFGVASANRDESRYDEPSAFRVDRTRPRDHLAFGTGPHVCPGATLARLEAAAVIEALCDRVSSLRLVEGFAPEPNPVFWALGHRRLPAVLT
ncbi:MAG TPA: cytochrome P450 [Acidimicrobiia bacterium]